MNDNKAAVIGVGIICVFFLLFAKSCQSYDIEMKELEIKSLELKQ